MPVVVAVVIFLFYYIVNSFGSNLATSGTIPTWLGMWFSTIVLAPIAYYLTMKSNNDSVVFNIDTYRNFFWKLFGIKTKRNVFRKEVIINDPDYESLKVRVERLTQNAKAYMEAYLSKYHGVRDYMEHIKRQAKTDGYVTTLYGRRREMPELKSSNFNIRSFGERVALNMPIQGTAADIIKIAMVRVYDRLKAEKLRAQLLLQVHDELIVECPEAEAEQVSRLLKEEMENAAQLSVPLTAEVHTGHSWAEAH